MSENYCIGIVASAHKIARIVYRMLKSNVEYQVMCAAEYGQRFRDREIKYMQHKANRLGRTLVAA